MLQKSGIKSPLGMYSIYQSRGNFGVRLSQTQTAAISIWNISSSLWYQGLEDVFNNMEILGIKREHVWWVLQVLPVSWVLLHILPCRTYLLPPWFSNQWYSPTSRVFICWVRLLEIDESMAMCFWGTCHIAKVTVLVMMVLSLVHSEVPVKRCLI